MLNGLISSLKHLKTKPSTLNPKTPSSGQVIAIVIAILMFFTIAVGVISFFLHSESKWTIKEKRSTTAFHLAEAGLDRGYWKLLESNDNFDNILKGISIPLYDGTTTFTDIPGGEYKIWITSTGQANEVRIRSVGRDASTKEIRAVEAIYKREGINTAIYCAGEFETFGSFTCHWGPIYSRGEMDLLGGAGRNAFPVKRSRAGITGQTASCVHTTEGGPHSLGRPAYSRNPPSNNSWKCGCQHPWYPTGWYEWQSFDEDIKIINITQDALNWYREQAKSQEANKAWESDDYGVVIGGRRTRYYNNTVPKYRLIWTDADDGTTTSGGGPQSTPNSVVSYSTYKSQWDIDKHIVRFIENTDLWIIGFGRKYLEGTLIVKNGDLIIAGTGKGKYRWPVPEEAWKQYCAVNTAAGGNEWPGDTPGPLGPPPAQVSEVSLGDGAWPGGNRRIGFHGFIYVTGDETPIIDFGAVGGFGIHGTIVVPGDVDILGGTVVYFDPEVAKDVKGVTQIKRISWKEVLVKSF